MGLFQTLNKENQLEGLELDKEDMLDTLEMGIIDRNNNEFGYIPFHEKSIGECYKIASMSIRFQEHVAEVISLTTQRERDAAAKLEEILNHSLTLNSNLKVTEAKAVAKGNAEYVRVQRMMGTLESWKDYLIRFSKTLDQIHYLSKNRIDNLAEAMKKPQRISQ